MLQDLLNAAAERGYTFMVYSDDEVDYKGALHFKALDAIEAVDEASMFIYDEDGNVIGWALIVNDLDEDERIADCSGWVDRWIDQR